MLKTFVLLIVAISASHGLPNAKSTPVSSTPANIVDIPYIVQLVESGFHVCVGSIISKSWIITAARCIDIVVPEDLQVLAGSDTLETGGTILSVDEIIVHPNWDFETNDFDLALIKLSTDLTFGSTISPIDLPQESETVPSGTLATASGWIALVDGFFTYPKQLQTLQVPIVSNEVCAANYRDDDDGPITDRMLCAIADERLEYPCVGDSGGPLVVKQTLIGIFSRGDGCARPNHPGIYTNVSNLRAFISQVTSL